MPLPPGTRPQVAQSQEFDPIPEGVYQVEIADITLKEKAKYKKPTEMEEVYDFEFTVLTAGDFRGRRLWTLVRPFIAAGEKPSKLYLITTRALGRLDLPEPEAIAFDPNDLIGKQLQVGLTQKTGTNSKVYNNVSVFMAATANLEPLEKSAPTPADVPDPAPAPSVLPPKPPLSPAGEAMRQGMAKTEDEINIDDIPF